MARSRALLCIVVALFCAGAWPQTAPQLRVATRVIEPFVMQDGGRLRGFSVDLWKAITDKMGAQSTFTIQPTIVDLLDAVKTNKADVGIAAISISAERDKDFDFSQPMFDSGLQVMIRNQEGGGAVVHLWDQILASGILRWLTVIFIIGLIPAHIVWIVERGCPRCILQN